MTQQVHTFAEGVGGQAVTNASSGGKVNIHSPSSGNMWLYVAPGYFGAPFKAQRTLDGTSGYLHYVDPSPSGREGVRMPFQVPSGAVTGESVLMQCRNTASGLVANVSLRTTKKVYLSPAGVGLVASESIVLAAGDYWLEFFGTHGTTTANGRAEYYIYAADGTTLVDSYDTGATVNLTTTQIDRFRCGNPTSSIGLTSFSLGEIQWGSKASGTFGKYVASTPPTGAIIDDTYFVADARTSTNALGGALSFSIGHVSGPNNLGQVVEFVEGLFGIPLDSSAAVYNITVSEVGNSQVDDITVNVPAIGSTAVIEELYWDGSVWK